MREQPPDHAVLALHRVEVAVPVAPPDGDSGDEVVEHEVVQHDEARRPPKRIEDPAVRVGVVANVVDGEIDTARGRLAPRFGTMTSTCSRRAGRRSAE